VTSKVTSSNSSRRSANSLNLASSIPRVFRSPLTPPAPAVSVQRQPIDPHCLAAVATNQESGIRNQSSVFRFQTSDTKDEALGTKHGCFLSTLNNQQPTTTLCPSPFALCPSLSHQCPLAFISGSLAVPSLRLRESLDFWFALGCFVRSPGFSRWLFAPSN
jgi:hypothetical protein